MFNIITGRAGSGKTEYIFDLIKKEIEKDTSVPELIVPEQFTFITERKLLKKLGAKNARKVKVTGFSRLALTVLNENNLITSPLIDDGTRLVFMSFALKELEGRLDIFKKFSSPNALSSLIDFNKEVKFSGSSTAEILSKLKENDSDNKLLCKKLEELSLISDTYDALVANGYFDDKNALCVFSEFCRNNKYFKGKTVFVDSFRSFSKPELDVLSSALSDSENVYVSFCTDNVKSSETPFEFVNECEKRLISRANELGVPVRTEVNLIAKNVLPEDIRFLEENIYTDSESVKNDSDNSVTVISCSDAEDECKAVACEIKKLLRSGEYRCRDIAVIERSEGTYKSKLVQTLKRYGIPVFDDSKIPLVSETLFIYLFSVFDCLNNGFSTDNVMKYLKSGLSGLSYREAAILEKYALVWKTGSKEWQNTFTFNPDGFGSEMTEETENDLLYIENLRKKAILPLTALKESVKDKNGAEIAKSVFEFCEKQNIRSKLFEMFSLLTDEGFEKEADRKERSYNCFVKCLDDCVELCGEKNISFNSWCEIFYLLSSSVELGEIPYGIDEVSVGSADRIRTSGVKATFLVGVNQDEFPLVNVSGGILNDRDRRILYSCGAELRPPYEKAAAEEKFIVYCSVTSPSQKLYLTYRNSTNGVTSYPSELIDTVKKMIPSVNMLYTSDFSVADKIESEDSAFSALASVYKENSEEKATLTEFFSDNALYSGKKEALKRAVSQNGFKFDNNGISKELFGKDIYISASKIEDFYKCRFRYFCRYGLNLSTFKEADLDSAQGGVVIHYILENILKNHDKESFLNLSEAELKEEISQLLSKYLEDKMGGADNKSKRFLFLFNRLTDIVLTVFARLKTEFGKCDFIPVDFELKIGGEKIPPYEVPLTEGSVKITGFVDRVDMYEKDGVKYLRVVDYKSGKKDFKLSDLLDGLNVQMVLYLNAIIKNGKNYYGDALPGAVLYLPSRIGYSGYLKKRSPDEDEINVTKIKSGRLSGMVLASPVVYNACGADTTDNYLPVKYDKKNECSGNGYTLGDFSRISKAVDKKIAEMGNALHDGIISALPVGEDSDRLPCKYCDYRFVCGYENGNDFIKKHSLRFGDTLRLLEEGEKNGLDS